MDSSWRTLMPEGWVPVVPFDRCFDAQYGLEVLSHDVQGDGMVRGRVVVRDALLNHAGVVHGGVFASAAEALASRGTALAVMPHGRVAMGLSNDTNVLEAPSEGVISITARVRGRADDAWVWTVDAHDDDGRLCAHSRVTVAVRDGRMTSA
jgi:1,4-dihydroxy-2-naphthoyl-CoA hydrolase